MSTAFVIGQACTTVWMKRTEIGIILLYHQVKLQPSPCFVGCLCIKTVSSPQTTTLILVWLTLHCKQIFLTKINTHLDLESGKRSCQPSWHGALPHCSLDTITTIAAALHSTHNHHTDVRVGRNSDPTKKNVGRVNQLLDRTSTIVKDQQV